MNDELKPCPFCGASGELQQIQFAYGPRNLGPLHVHVHCPTCHAAIASYDTREEAIANWNRRAPVSVDAALKPGTSGGAKTRV